MIPDDIPPAPFSQDPNGHSLRLLDYSVVRTGTVVPQVRWSPKNVNDYRQHVSEATLQMPIYFLQKGGVLGLSLYDAINGRCQTLRDSRVQARLGGKTTTHIRIGVCSRRPTSVESTYDDGRARYISVAWVQRIQTPSSDQRRDRRKKSHHRRKVCPSCRSLCGGLPSGQFFAVDLWHVFILKLQQNPKPMLTSPSQTQTAEFNRWAVGQGGINPNNIRIIGAIHVSAGSWMPILQLNGVWIF
jgi:hypothetical protein